LQKSDSLIRFISFVVFLAMVFCFAYSVYRAKVNPLKTAEATDFEITDSVSTEGWAVRSEQLLTGGGRNVSAVVSEGESVSAGETLAVEYSGSDALERAERIRELRLEIAQLSSQKTSADSASSAWDSVLALSAAVAARDLSELDALELSVRSCVMEQAGGEDPQARAAELQSELDKLTGESASDTGNVSASGAGVFSFVTDGFEGVTPSDLDELTPSKLADLFGKAGSVGGGVFGKLVTGIRWYYATTMDAESALQLRAGGTATLSFSRTYSNTLSMDVVSISSEEDGKCAVVFSSKKYIQDVAALRSLSAELVLRKLTGLRVPREAVHLDGDGSSYVYVLQGLQAKKTPITIQGESSDSYLASGGESLRAGDQIITRANGLYDGKVVGGQ